MAKEELAKYGQAVAKQEAPIKVEAVITTDHTRRCDAEEIGVEEVVVSVVGERGMTEVGEHVSEEGNVGVSSVVLEGDLVGLLCTCSDKWSGIPNSFSATPFPADSHSDYLTLHY